MASALLSVIGNQLVPIIRDEVKLAAGARDEVLKLNTTLTMLQKVLESAEEKQVRDEAVRFWLEQLKAVAYDADDVLDEWNTGVLNSQIEGTFGNETIISKVCSYLAIVCACFHSLVMHREIGHKIEGLRKRLDLIAREKDYYNLIESQSREKPRPVTSSLIDVSEIYGRVDDKEMIMSKLLTVGCQKMNVIAIVGTAGFGKTALAQLIHTQEKQQTNFDKVIWVCVSRPFDVVKVAKEIIEEVQGNVPSTTLWQALHENLFNVVQGKKFFLVLDDVWSYDEKDWRQLKLALDSGAPGSRVIVTTRDERVSRMMGATYTHRLEKLSDDDCWSLFRHIAFAEIQDDVQRFEEIGMKIAKNCKGVPLAVRISASLMRLKTTITEWRNVLASDIWEVRSEVERGFLPEILLSYYDLTPELKQCFLYCAIFPEDDRIVKDDLVKLWMAQGFLGLDRNRDLEIIGGSYFDNLVMRSFFQDMDKDGKGNTISCKMHDLVHNFAQFITKSESSCLVSDVLELGGNELRHLSFWDLTNTSIYNQKKLRTLRPSYTRIRCEEVSVGLFHQLTCLRVLDLHHMRFEELPNEVGNLLHLRYLNMSGTRLKELPQALCDLLNLQTLKLNGCKQLCKLPEGIGRLLNLRHLEIKASPNLSYYPQGLGVLTCLRTLHKFKVCEDSGGCKLGELKLLNHLEGSLHISGLEQVADVNEGATAELEKKGSIHILEIDFLEYLPQDNVGEEAAQRTEGVLQHLQPNKNLEKLKVQGYLGRKLPIWMSTLQNVVTLKLDKCVQCVQLPALGKLASLQVLFLNYLCAVRQIGSEFYGLVGADTMSSTDPGEASTQLKVVVFPKLKKLELVGMFECEEWDIPFQKGIEFFPILHDLRLSRCPNLQVLPALGKLNSLQNLEINEVLRVKHLGHLLGGISEEEEKLSLFPKLKKLWLKKMSAWEELEDMHLEGTSITAIMPCLHKLQISECPKLKVIPCYMFSHSLRDVVIYQCPQLTQVQPSLPRPLEKLTLGGEVGDISRSLSISGILKELTPGGEVSDIGRTWYISESPFNNYPNLKEVSIYSSLYSSLPHRHKRWRIQESYDMISEDLKHHPLFYY